MPLPQAEWVILHNPRCSKSREALELLKNKKINPTIIEYLKSPLNTADLKDLCKRLNLEAKDLLRKKEAVIIEEKIDISTQAKALQALSKFPVLLERPVVIHKNKAVIARPAEKILDLL